MFAANGHEGVHVTDESPEVHGADAARLVGDLRADGLGIHEERVGIDVAEHRLGPQQQRRLIVQIQVLTGQITSSPGPMPSPK